MVHISEEERLLDKQIEENKRRENRRVATLNKLDTKQLVDKMYAYEKELEDVLKDQAMYVSQHHDYISSRGTDCQAVKGILAELTAQAPAEIDGKKTTVADRDAWLQKQRKENKELEAAIVRQREVAFLVDDWQIKVEMVKKRLEGVKAVIGLRTKQIDFLANG